MEMEKQMFGNMFAGTCRDYGTESGLWSPGPPKFPHHISPIFFVGTSGDSSILGTASLPKFIGQLRGS